MMLGVSAESNDPKLVQIHAYCIVTALESSNAHPNSLVERQWKKESERDGNERKKREGK